MFNFPTAVKSTKISLKLPIPPNNAELIPQTPTLAFFPVIPALSADLNYGEGKKMGVGIVGMEFKDGKTPGGIYCRKPTSPQRPATFLYNRSIVIVHF
jgi:hypothetical protein